MLLAGVVAVVHGAAVLFMLTGSLLALRWPRLLYLHVPVALAILAVNLAGQPCPLTDLELALRDGYSTYHGLGLGLPGARRLMDEFAVVSEVGRGTTVTMTKWCREG